MDVTKALVLLGLVKVDVTKALFLNANVKNKETKRSSYSVRKVC